MAGLFFLPAAGASDGFGSKIKMLRGETLERASPRSGLERVMRHMAFDRTIYEEMQRKKLPRKRGAGRTRPCSPRSLGRGLYGRGPKRPYMEVRLENHLTVKA